MTYVMYTEFVSRYLLLVVVGIDGITSQLQCSRKTHVRHNKDMKRILYFMKKYIFLKAFILAYEIG